MKGESPGSLLGLTFSQSNQHKPVSRVCGMTYFQIFADWASQVINLGVSPGWSALLLLVWIFPMADHARVSYLPTRHPLSCPSSVIGLWF